jgi:hypothetical protein
MLWFNLRQQGKFDLSGVRIQSVSALPYANTTIGMISQYKSEIQMIPEVQYLSLGSFVVLLGNDMWGGAAESRGSMNLKLERKASALFLGRG